MKKILLVLLSVMLALPFAACGKLSAPKTSETKIKVEKNDGKLMSKFDKSATIEKAVIYDENGIKITADKLTYTDYSAELKLLFENNTESSLSFVSGSSGYHVNSVNGYMVDDGYIYCDVDAGQTAEDKISLDFKSLNVFGITGIADIEIGFDITDDDYNSVETGPLQIKTTLANSYDYSENTYCKVIENGSFEKKFNCKINSFSKETLYDEDNIKITSAAVMTNKDNETIIALEAENNSDSEVVVCINDIYFDKLSVCDSVWSGNVINANKKCIIDISLNQLADYYEDEENAEKISEISNLTFTISVGESAYDTQDAATVTIPLQKIKLSAEKDKKE